MTRCHPRTLSVGAHNTVIEEELKEIEQFKTYFLWR